MADYIETPTMGEILSEGLFSAAKIARLKNTASLLTTNSMIDVCAFRASMQQFSKLIFYSTVAFIGRISYD